MAPLGTGGLLAAILTPAGAVELRAFDVFRNANDFIADDIVSQHTAPDAGSLDLARVPTTHCGGRLRDGGHGSRERRAASAGVPLGGPAVLMVS